MRWLLPVAIWLLCTFAAAQPPTDYYDALDRSSEASLRESLHLIIDDHTRIPYTADAVDTWDVIASADEDPLDSGRVLTIYKNASYEKIFGGRGAYNREHSWPKSYGFPDDRSSNYPYTDLHALFAADSSYNSSRSNLPFGTCDETCSERETEAYNGVGGTLGVYPGQSNWRRGSNTTGTWEVWRSRRGDIARAMFYMALRYEGGNHGATGHAEPDLKLTDDLELIAGSNTGENEQEAYMGRLSVLLQWHTEDPVDGRERQRNDVVYLNQGNRNPFVDFPEFVGVLWGDDPIEIINGSDGSAEQTPAALFLRVLNTSQNTRMSRPVGK